MIDDILKNKQSPQKVQTPEQQPKPVQQVTRQAPAAPNLAAVVTASEIEGVRNKIRPCWNSLGGLKDQGLIVTLVVQMNQDGTPVKAELKDPGRYNSDPDLSRRRRRGAPRHHESALPALAVVARQVQRLAHHHLQLRSPRLLISSR